MAKQQPKLKMDFTAPNLAELEKERNELLVLKTSKTGLSEIQQKKLAQICETLDYINYGLYFDKKLKNENNE